MPCRKNDTTVHVLLRWPGLHTTVHVPAAMAWVTHEAITAQSYITKVLQPEVFPYPGAKDEDFLIQDDNVRPHRALCVSEFTEKRTESIPWSTKFPEISQQIGKQKWDVWGRLLHWTFSATGTIGSRSCNSAGMWFHTLLWTKLCDIRRQIEECITKQEITLISRLHHFCAHTRLSSVRAANCCSYDEPFGPKQV